MLIPTDHPLPVPPLPSPPGEELRALALMGVIGKALAAGRQPLLRGLSEERLLALLAAYLPGQVLLSAASVPAADRADHADHADDEYDDIVELLLEYRAVADESGAWLCHAIATAAMGEQHLWQDMGLPNRQALSDLLRENFPALAAKNCDDMKWKKFFYRQLCERAGVPICKAPHCAECCDRALCFGPEDGAA